jgi:DNA polymerase-4
MAKYKAVSNDIRALFLQATPLVEPLSLDEAYLDVTEDRCGIGSATAIASDIRARIRAETGLTASAGVSYNKFIAKLASDQNKPDGLCVITPAHGPGFVQALPVKRFHGVGPVTAARMERLGILTGADLAGQSLAFLERHFGSSAAYLHGAARGIDHRPVRADRERKSIGAERTFEIDLVGRQALLTALEPIVEAVWTRIERAGAVGRTVTLKLKLADFRILTRARTQPSPIADRASFAARGAELLDAVLPLDDGVRLLGLTLSGLGAAAPGDDGQPRLL